MPTGCNAKPGSPSWLHEPVAHWALVVGDEHTAQLREAGGRIIEHSQDRLSIGDRQSNESLLGVKRTRSASPVSSKPAAYKSAARAATFSSRTETPASLTRRRYPAQWSVKRKPFRPDLAGPQARHRQGEGWVLSRRDPGSADFVPARTQSQTGQPVSALEAGVRDRKPKASSPSCLRATSDEAPVRAD
jgi:hypothetical protein